MNIFNFIVLVVALISYSLSILTSQLEDNSMSSGYMYRRANMDDVDKLVRLMTDHAAPQDSDKIVIVPEKFRQQYFQGAVTSRRLYIATTAEGDVVGYKKLFCVTDESERQEILQDELRFSKDQFVAGAVADMRKEALFEVGKDAIAEIVGSRNVTYVYSGADFTHPAHRGKHINTELTRLAFKEALGSVVQDIENRRSRHVAIVYGLTEFNATTAKDSKKEEKINLLGGRSRGILREANSFLNDLSSNDLPMESFLYLARFRSFKPSFDSKSTECKPLPDAKSISGYGCLIASALQRKRD